MLYGLAVRGRQAAEHHVRRAEIYEAKNTLVQMSRIKTSWGKFKVGAQLRHCPQSRYAELLQRA